MTIGLPSVYAAHRLEPLCEYKVTTFFFLSCNIVVACFLYQDYIDEACLYLINKNKGGEEHRDLGCDLREAQLELPVHSPQAQCRVGEGVNSKRGIQLVQSSFSRSWLPLPGSVTLTGVGPAGDLSCLQLS